MCSLQPVSVLCCCGPLLLRCLRSNLRFSLRWLSICPHSLLLLARGVRREVASVCALRIKSTRCSGLASFRACHLQLESLNDARRIRH